MAKRKVLTVGQLRKEIADAPDNAKVLVLRLQPDGTTAYEEAVEALHNDSLPRQEIWIE